MKTLKLLLFVLFVLVVNGYSQNPDAGSGELMSLNGTELYVKIIGKGEPVIVVHGGPVLDHSYLLSHLEFLSESYQLIFFDQRLSGRSTADVDTADIRMKMFVEDIEALRASLQLDQVHILAHSWGGLLAMKYAIKYPAHTKTLMLLNSMPPSSELWQREEAILAKTAAKEDSLARQDIIQSELFRDNPPAAVEQLLLLSFKNQFYNPRLTDSLDLYVPEDYMTRSRLFGNLMVDLTQYNLLDELKTLPMPALIVYGSTEPAATLSGRVLHEHIPNSEFTVIKKSGHFPFIEQPEKFKDILLAFLNKH